MLDLNNNYHLEQDFMLIHIYPAQSFRLSLVDIHCQDLNTSTMLFCPEPQTYPKSATGPDSGSLCRYVAPSTLGLSICMKSAVARFITEYRIIFFYQLDYPGKLITLISILGNTQRTIPVFCRTEPRGLQEGVVA